MKRTLLAMALLSSALWAAPPKVTWVKLYQDNNGEAGKEVSYFRPSQHKLHLTAHFDSLKVGQTKVKWVFTGVETSAGRNIKVQELDVAGLVVNESSASLKLPRDWPFGNYKVDLFVDGQPVKSFLYIISPAPEELKAGNPTLFRDQGGKAGPKVAQFSPKDHVQHFEFEVNGYLMGKVKARWTYTAVDTTAGKNRVVATEEVDVSNFPGNTLTGHVSLPRDWPTGTYQVDVALNGRPLIKIPYKVQ